MKIMHSRNIYLVRHGHREDFIGASEQINKKWALTADNRFNPALSALGKVQASQLAENLKFTTINHIFSSPFLRTVETASAIASCCGIKVKIEHGLSEWLNPEWFPCPVKHLDFNQLCSMFPKKIDTHYHSMVSPAFPEPHESVHLWPRVAQTIYLLLKHFDGDLLLVGHGASVSAASYFLANGLVDIKTRLCGLIQFRQENNLWKLIKDGSS